MLLKSLLIKFTSEGFASQMTHLIKDSISTLAESWRGTNMEFIMLFTSSLIGQGALTVKDKVRTAQEEWEPHALTWRWWVWPGLPKYHIMWLHPRFVGFKWCPIDMDMHLCIWTCLICLHSHNCYLTFPTNTICICFQVDVFWALFWSLFFFPEQAEGEWSLLFVRIELPSY